MIGKTFGHYRIVKQIGQGGMGVVYLAHDTLLDRKVAVKFLPDSLKQDETARKRFDREARSAAALDHPFICAIHEVGEAEGKSFIVMEHLEGQTLRDRLAQGSIPLKQAMQWAVEIAEALAVAHEKGIIHRDLKPANIMLLRTGHTKVMDFGLAKQVFVSPQSNSQEETLTGLTKEGTTVGTLPYMSPEQVQGKRLDLRSDLFSFGIVLYEMLTGVNPFKKDSGFDTAEAILKEIPAPVSKYSSDAPPSLVTLVNKLLAKDPKDRYPQAREAADNLQITIDEAFGHKIVVTRSVFAILGKALKNPACLIPLILVLAAAAYFSIQGVKSYQKKEWAREIAPKEVEGLIDQSRPIAAARILKEAERYAPNSGELERLEIGLFKSKVTIKTMPPDADIYVRDYSDAEENGSSPWELLGRSPLTVDLPIGDHRFRLAKQGFEPVERVHVGEIIRLHPQDKMPAGMVWAPGIPKGGASPAVAPSDAGEYWIDKHEVTNRQFKEFVDAGGYQKREYWENSFVRDGKQISWDQAMALFVDQAGKPGPATWAFGSYPEGKEDYPVSGVSWYEAAAYAEFAGKSLPSIYHWAHASGMDSRFGEIVRFSNFSTKGLARVGAYRGLGNFGTYDMAGNVKEWCWNQTGNSRYMPGGAWNETTDTFSMADARPPFDRSDNLGFRCIKYMTPPAKAFFEPVESVGAVCTDRRKDAPVDDRTYRIFLQFHSYQKNDLKATTIAVDDVSSPYWRREKVAFQAAYGNERMSANLYLPKNAQPPYQIAIFFPGSPGLTMKELDPYEFRLVELMLRSGRALMLPVYKGMFERGPTPQGYLDKDLCLCWSKDLGRSIDYLETRSDIDLGKLAYVSYSMGAWAGPRLVAVESRVKAAVLAATCSGIRVSDEVDPWNFASRVRIPVLVLSGRSDFICPLETSVKPLFDLLGTPNNDKNLKEYDRGHALFDGLEVFRDMFDWLDRRLGPVRMTPAK